MPDPARVDPLLQFILAVAGQQDETRERELGPIHLLKYAYLADLAHAELHNGQTYTDAPWRFYDFGPWSPPLLDRIGPALEAVGAEQRTVTGAYGDFVRYSLHDERLLDHLDAHLPSVVVSAVRWAVREFGSDTPSLLRHVYLTAPMLKAAPGEMLVFEARPSMAVAEPAADEEQTVLRQRRKIATKLREEFRRHVGAMGTERRPLAPAEPPPRYDEVFFDGVAWLDQQEGEPFPVSEGELVFSPEIWKSRGRSESGGDAS